MHHKYISLFNKIRDLISKIFVTTSFRIFIVFTVIVSIVNISMGFISYNNTIKIVKNDQQQYSFELLDVTEDYVDIFARDMQNLIVTLSEMDFMKRYGKLEDSFIEGQMDIFAQSRVEYIDAIHFIGTDNKFISTDRIKLQLLNKPADLESYKNAVASGTNVYWTKPYLTVQKDITISCSRVVMDYSGKTLGVVIIDTNFNKLNNIIKNISNDKNQSFILLDDKGLIVSSNQGKSGTSGLSNALSKNYLDERIFSETRKYERGVIQYIPPQGERKFIYYSNIPKFGWEIISVVDYSVFEQKTHSVRNSFRYFNAIFIFLIILLAFLFAVYITRPLKKLTHQMEKVKTGDFSLSPDIRRRDEIGKLSSTFNGMLIKIQDLIADVAKKEKSKRESDFKVLQAQINPHFLYNTLSSVNCMAAMKRNEEIQTMVTALINLLQASINKMDEIITIGQELENLKNYITIQKLRYGDKFDVSYLVDENLSEFKIPKLLLQPLVENAIFHGIQPKEGNGLIQVKAELQESKICLTVEDDGVGITEERLSQLQKDDVGQQKSTSVGIKNVDQRIKLYFGEEYGLEVESGDNAGCRICVYIPVMI